jgi:hypothetical protein
MIKSDQYNVIRDPNRIIENRFQDERSTEELAVAFIAERERIRSERKAELEERQERRRNFGLNPDNLRESLKERSQDAIINRLPLPLRVPTEIIAFAQENQLRGQSLLLGLPDELPDELVGEAPYIELPSLVPFIPPMPDIPDNASQVYREMMIPENTGITFTLKWNYRGWSSPTIINHPQTGQTVQLSGVTFLGDSFTGGRGVGNFNPKNNPQEIAPFLQGNPLSNVIGRLVRPDSRWGKGWSSLAPIPIEAINPNETASMNAYFPPGFRRQNYWSAFTVLGRQRFNVNGIPTWAEDIIVNFRADITVGLESAWSLPGWVNRYPNRLIMQFFESYNWITLNSEVGLVVPEIDGNPVKINPKGGGKKPISPPPPKPRCKPMSCCPSQNSNLEEIKRMVRQLLANLGNPKDLALWDEDISKPGQQAKKFKPKDAFEHLTSLTERVEIALRIIGITDLPIDVDESRSFYPELGKLYESSSNPDIKKLGKDLLKRDRRSLTSVLQALDWYADAIDEKLGAFEMKTTFDDIDLVKEGNQNVVLYHANLQEALHDTMKFAFQGGIHSEANLQLIAKTMGDVAVLKKEIVGQSYKLDLLIDYLGMGYTEKPEQLPISVSFSEDAMKDLAQKKLTKYLSDSEIPIARPLLGEKEVNLATRLTELENVVSSVAAAHRMPVPSIDVIKEMLKRLGKGEDWGNFLKDMQKLADDAELQLNIKDITGDKEKTKR